MYERRRAGNIVTMQGTSVREHRCGVAKIKDSSKQLDYFKDVWAQPCNTPPLGAYVEALRAILGNTLYSKWSLARDKLPSDPVANFFFPKSSDRVII